MITTPQRTPLTAPISALSAARVAAVGYIALFALAIFANFVVREGLIDMTDASATVAAVREHETLFRLGLAAFAAIVVIDIAVAWALYALFAPGGRDRALIAAWFRLVYSGLLGVAVAFLALALHAATSGPELDDALVLLFVAGFDGTWMIGLITFGVHLILLGALIVRSRIAPRPMGIVLTLAGAAYIVDSVLTLVLTDYAAIADLMLGVVVISSMASELAFTVWLVLASRRAKQESPRRGGAPTTPRTLASPYTWLA